MNFPAGGVRRSAPATTGWMRWARAGAVAALALALSAGAHIAGGGEPAPLGILTIAAIPLLALTALCTGRRLRAAPAVLLLGGQQLVLHHLFMAAGHAPGPLTDGHHLPRHGPATGSIAAAELTGIPAAVDVPMTLAHVAAALAVGVALAGIDRVLFFLLDLFERPIRVVSGAVPRHRTAPRMLCVRRRCAPAGVDLDVAPSRGPPRSRTASPPAPRAALLG